MSELVLLGDEAVGLGALHAGASFAYGYPGTPSTEIIEYMQSVIAGHPEFLFQGSKEPAPRAIWCSNEKTAYEAAVGASLANRRSIVTMKHVGLNVAMDPYMNSVLMNIQGGLVVAVGDDPGMHSSQNEQDSRWLADFAKIPCLEPRNQQEAYEMARYAFELSERYHVPVLIKLVTRLCHSRAVVSPAAPADRRPMRKFGAKDDFMVLPAISRRHYAAHLKTYEELHRLSDASAYNPLAFAGAAGSSGGPASAAAIGATAAQSAAVAAARKAKPFAVITTGLGGNYYDENAADLAFSPDRLHIGMYPLPYGRIRELAASASRVICIEEGYPYVERLLKGVMPQALIVSGKLDGTLPPAGELNPDIVRAALGLPAAAAGPTASIPLPERPPQLCQGCPHADTMIALKEALAGYPESLVNSDIGCYSLGYLPPYEVAETALCMGASVTMSRGAADSGLTPSVALLGDSTFMHSGLTGLVDAASGKVDMTVIIMDNLTTGMTGGQETIVDSAGIKRAALGCGVDPEHCVEIVPLAKNRELNVSIIKKELEYKGTSVIIARRECIQTLKRKNSKAREAAARPSGSASKPAVAAASSGEASR